MKLKEIKDKYYHYFVDNRGRKQGEYLEYYDNGQLYTKYHFKDNKLDGEYLSYHSNGKLSIKCYYKNNKFDGEFLDYHKNGKLNIKCYYKDGKEISEEKWFKNYDIENKLKDILG